MPLFKGAVKTEEGETDFFEAWAGSEAGNSGLVKVHDVQKHFSGEGQTCGRQQNIMKVAEKKRRMVFRFVENTLLS